MGAGRLYLQINKPQGRVVAVDAYTICGTVEAKLKTSSLNTAMLNASDPVLKSEAFKTAVKAGRNSFLAN